MIIRPPLFTGSREVPTLVIWYVTPGVWFSELCNPTLAWPKTRPGRVGHASRLINLSPCWRTDRGYPWVCPDGDSAGRAILPEELPLRGHLHLPLACMLYPRQDTEGTWGVIPTSKPLLKAHSPGAGEHGIRVTLAQQGMERKWKCHQYKENSPKSPGAGPEMNQTLRLVFLYYCVTKL